MHLCLFSLSRLLPLYPASPLDAQGLRRVLQIAENEGYTLLQPWPRECVFALGTCTLAPWAWSVRCTITTSVLSFIYAASAEECFLQQVLPWLSQIGCLPSLTELTTWVVYMLPEGASLPGPENRLLSNT